MRNKLNIGDEIIVKIGDKVIGNEEKGKITGINIFQGELLYDVNLERGFDNCNLDCKDKLPINSVQVREGQYEIVSNVDLPEENIKIIKINSLKEKFIAECENRIEDPKYLMVAVQLPTGAIEIITNTEQLGSKCEYYKNTYDENFCLKANSSVKIVNYMLV